MGNSLTFSSGPFAVHSTLVYLKLKCLKQSREIYIPGYSVRQNFQDPWKISCKKYQFLPRILQEFLV